MDYPALTVRVLTFNTAVGNPKITTRQQDLLSLPFYREVIEGVPGAPILALQEVGPEQATALKAACAGGRFELVHVQRPGQGNALLIPARYARAAPALPPLRPEPAPGARRGALGRTVTRRERLNVRQYLELRFWSRARLADQSRASS